MGITWGISNRFATIFSLLVLIATGTVGYTVYQGARQSLIDSAVDRLVYTSETIEVRLFANIESIGKDVHFLAATPPVQGLVRTWIGRRRGMILDPETAISDREWRDQLAEIFEVFLRNRQSYVRVRLVNSLDNGREMVRVEKRKGGTERIPRGQLGTFSDSTLTEYNAFPRTKGIYLSEIVQSDSSDAAIEAGVPVIRIAYPVYTQSGDKFGFVVIDVDLGTVLETLRELANPDRSLYIANNRGKLLLAPVTNTESEKRSAGTVTIQELFPQTHLLIAGAIDYVQIKDAIAEGDSLSTAYFKRINLGHEPHYDSLLLGITSPHSVILDRVRRVRDRSVLITLLFCIGGIVLAMSFSGFLTRPLSQITHAFSSFGREEETMDLPVNRSDEIGVLARAFKIMAIQIQDQLRELEDKERRQRIIFETSAGGIIVYDSNGIIETFNRAAERMFGYRSEDIIGKNVSLLLFNTGLDDQHEQAQINDELEQLKSSGTGQEVMAQRVDGQKFPVSIAVSSFVLLGEKKYAAFIEDITERKRYEEALQRAKEQAEEMARLKSAFLANMSHEIRTPLTSVIGYSSLLVKEVNEKHRRFAQLIERSGRRLLDTLNSVLALAQLEANQVEVQFDTITVFEELKEIVQLHQQTAESKGLSLKLTGENGGEALRARLDRGALSSIMQNLIGNAIKFTESGEVEVSVGKEGEKVLIRVRDTGVGIDESFFPHLFEEFRQESTGLSRTYEGSGLGLSITRRLVELMGGEITVSSEKGEGSVFTVFFPLVAEELSDIEEEDIIDEEDKTLLDSLQSDILLVEDNRETAYLILHLLLDICDVTLASTSSEAIKKAQLKQFDVVLLDINLGEGENGVDVLKKLRKLDGYEETPVIAVTAYALPGDRERFLEAGFNGYLSKPFTVETLHTLISELLPAQHSA